MMTDECHTKHVDTLLMFLMACPLSEDSNMCGGMEKTSKKYSQLFLLEVNSSPSPADDESQDVNNFHAVMRVWKILQKWRGFK